MIPFLLDTHLTHRNYALVARLNGRTFSTTPPTPAVVAFLRYYFLPTRVNTAGNVMINASWQATMPNDMTAPMLKTP